jgi:hydrogenase maturation factor
LKYVQFRENQELKARLTEVMTKLKDKKKAPLQIMDVSGGYDEAIERYCQA